MGRCTWARSFPHGWLLTAGDAHQTAVLPAEHPVAAASGSCGRLRKGPDLMVPHRLDLRRGYSRSVGGETAEQQAAASQGNVGQLCTAPVQAGPRKWDRLFGLVQLPEQKSAK